MKPRPPQALPISKLRGVAVEVRASLKRKRITTCEQLLRAAGPRGGRGELAEATGIDPETLLRLVQRADLARVSGIGAVFGAMLEAQTVQDVGSLRRQDARRLHRLLVAYNAEERLARRSPTPEEVEDWVTQARALPDVIEP